jgi:hypothetical protein
MEKQPESKVIIYSRTGKIEIARSEIIDFHSTSSVDSFCASIELTIRGQKKEIKDLIEPKREIEIWIKIKENWEKLEAGYIDKIVLEKKENSDETIQIYGRSYEAILVDTKITGIIEFRQGYSNVIRAILKDTPLVEGEVENSSEEGTIFFRNIAIIEVIKNIMENNNWIFRVDKNKIYYFSKNPPKNEHHLGSNDIKGYRIVKE